ncbi:formylglycine-generating enzyme family protein [Flavobacteriales bacterium]|nr:formylglycine-generating enzyme family protein [Flavobacteriales bacterium]
MRTIKLLFLMLPFVSLCQIPGCVPIRGQYLWMSETEVSNRYYHEFLSAISNEDSVKNYPKTFRWTDQVAYGEPMQKFYFKHPAYTDYPLVNITYENATAYCTWLTKILNRNFSYQKVLVRLPTEKEWEDAAKAGNKYANYPWGTESMRVAEGKNQGKFQANFVLRKGNSIMDGATITAPVNSYWQNGFGLYNMSGNVSEMVSEKGLVKGGSWSNRADWLRIEKQQYVYSASPEVGFRYVVEVIELPQPKKKAKSIVLNKKYFKTYFAEINDTLSVGKYEVTNELFKQMVSLAKVQVPLRSYNGDGWKNVFPYSQIWENNYYSHPDFYKHPVVNVDLSDVEVFCNWLEAVYFNINNERIEIRLPTEQEWSLAARGGKEKSPYPWGGPYIRNSKGCYLANFNPKMSEDENVNGYDTLTLNNFFQTHFTDLNDFDGEAVLAPVDSYFPNDYGLYNMSGNVAEMVLDSNYTKGGSWKSKSHYLQINSQEEWNKKANPFTGFRVVMIKKKL